MRYHSNINGLYTGPYAATYLPKGLYVRKPATSKRTAPAQINHEKGGIVYALYFKARGFVKIGHTKRPRSRFRTLCRNMADDGFWFAALYGDKNDERAVLDHFKNWRDKGEFFRCNQAFIEELERYITERGGRFRTIDLSRPRFTA